MPKSTALSKSKLFLRYAHIMNAFLGQEKEKGVSACRVKFFRDKNSITEMVKWMYLKIL